MCPDKVNENRLTLTFGKTRTIWIYEVQLDHESLHAWQR